MRMDIVKTCNYCGGETWKPYLSSDVVRWYQQKKFKTQECTNCSLISVVERPDRHKLYQDYLKGTKAAKAVTERKLKRPNVLQAHTRAVRAAVDYYAGANNGEQPSRIFDMGFGAGTIMEAARQFGLEAGGNEINLFSLNRMKKLGFNDVHHGFTSEIRTLKKSHYNIVINLDYLEHSYEPFDDLKICWEMLTPGGVLYLKTLYLDCPDHLLKGEAYQLFGDGHFHYFRVRTLLSMIFSAGFDILSVTLGGLITVVAQKQISHQTKINAFKNDNATPYIFEKRAGGQAIPGEKGLIKPEYCS